MRITNHKIATISLFAFFAIYLIVLFHLTVFRHPNVIPNMANGEWQGFRSLSLVPFATIAEYLRFIVDGKIIIGISNLLGNVIIFLPLGYMTALLFSSMRKTVRILILAISFSLFIEGCQYVFAVGATDIDDLLLNTLGGIAGYRLYLFISRFSGQKKYATAVSAFMIAFACAGFFVGNHEENLLQGSVAEISEDRIVVSRTYLSNAEDANAQATEANRDFAVGFSDDCMITLMDRTGKKTIAKSDIRLNDLVLLQKFLLSKNGVYMAEEVEIYRTIQAPEEGGE